MRPIAFSWFVLAAACSASQPDDGEASPDTGGTQVDSSGGSSGDLGSSGTAGSGTGGSSSTGATSGAGGRSGSSGALGAGGRPATGGASGVGGSAGATNGSDGGGASGGPAHMVGACDGLGAIDQWESVTPPGVAFVGSVAVDPVNAGTVYAGTGATSGTNGVAQGFRKSTNCGATWTEVSTGKNGDLFHSGTDYGITVDWLDPKNIYSATLYGSNNSLLKSTSAGVDWDILFPPGSPVANALDFVFVQEFSMDPTNHLHVAATFHVSCKGEYAPMCLGETRDGGATWHVFKGPLKGWGENARPYVIGDKSLLFISWGDGAFYTADSSVAVPVWQQVTPYGGYVHHASNGNHYLASYKGIYRSTDTGQSWSLIPNSPRGYAITGDGKRLFLGGDVADNYHTAQESADTTWQSLAAPKTPDAYITFSYDGDHHILYSSNHTTGLLRMVTR